MHRPAARTVLHRRPARLVVVLLLLLPLAGVASHSHHDESFAPSSLEDVIARAPSTGGATPREERQQTAPEAPVLANGALLAVPELDWRFCCRGAAERTRLKRGFPDRVDRPPSLA